MNPGPVEEAGSTVRTAITALQTNPTCLAAILLAAMFSLLIYFSVQRERSEAHEHSMAVLERCFPIALMQGFAELQGIEPAELPKGTPP